FSVYGIDFDAYGMGADHIGFTGVKIQTHRTRVDNIYGDWLSTIVSVGDEDKVAILDDNKITNVESGENVVFNLLATGTRNLYFDNITVSYRTMKNVATPPHLIYLTGDRLHYNVQGGYAASYNGKNSFAFQFKGVEGGHIQSLFSKGSKGILHISETDGL